MRKLLLLAGLLVLTGAFKSSWAQDQNTDKQAGVNESKFGKKKSKGKSVGSSEVLVIVVGIALLALCVFGGSGGEPGYMPPTARLIARFDSFLSNSKDKAPRDSKKLMDQNPKT